MQQTAASVVRVRDLTQRYGSVIALKSISLELPAGQMIGLLGPDGVGKSTLLDLIAGARIMQQGDLCVLGGDMRDAGHRDRLGTRLAYMPQGLGKNLYHALSVRENLNFFGQLFGLDRTMRGPRIERLTKATGLDPFLDRPAGKLSGGMKQKLGLCCALLHDPDLLILDEPTTGVDPLSRRQFWQLIDAIRAKRQGLSVLVSTAYMDEAERFDFLVAMDNGKVLDTGTPETLKARTGAGDLESAFIRLLPEEKRSARTALHIPALPESDGEPAIVARHLTRRFGDFTAVDDVSFEIRPGEIFGFLGSNGCGKTTTMKMLTGLLPMTEGQAELFGKPIDARDLKMRKRVGFMSQAFSLYGELTVMQNLALHGRLFAIEPDHAKARIAALVRRFDLTDHLHVRAGSLPLGLRQRLSLAVAVLHEPDVLILDEPTSGVDPVARDDFWELLVELSRRDKVTIFVSTHFMNEAMRCDRVSLMHAGQVLVCETPQELAAQSASGTLEDTFIGYIEKADRGGQRVEPIATAEDQPAFALAVDDIERHDIGDTAPISLSRLAAISTRETMEVLRDPIRLAFAFVGSMLLLIVIALGISLDVEDVTIAVLDQDRTPEARQYMNTFYGSRSFAPQPELVSRDDLVARMADGSLTVAVEIPSGFGRDLKKGHPVNVSIWIDGAKTIRAGTIKAYVNGAHARYLAAWARKAGLDPATLQGFKIENRYRYNPTFESIMSIGPAVPAILLMVFPAILMAVSIAREKEIGTITNFYVTPTKKAEFLIGKQLPYIAIAMINYLILTFMVVVVLGVEFKGSFAALSVGALLYAIAVTAFGLLISSITSTQIAAVFAASILSLMPTVQFSGLIQPISTLSETGQLVGTLWPASYFLHLSVGAYTKGLSFGDLAPDLIALALFAPALMVTAIVLLRNQER